MSELFEGLAYLGNWVYWVAFAAAVITAALVGLLPGVSSTLVMALSIPFIVQYIDDPLIGIVMLTTLAGVGGVMRSVSPVLFGLPRSSNQVTYLEGSQLARRGQAAHALGAAYAVSTIGSLTGVLVLALALLVGAPLVRLFIFDFGGMPFVAVSLFVLVIVALLNSEAMLKGLAAAALGLLLGASGLESSEGTLRSAFGESDRWDTLLLTATSVGVFALAEVVDLTMTRQPLSPQGVLEGRSEVFRGVRYGLGRWRIAVRQALFGGLVSLVPWMGGAAVHWLSYALGIFLTKDKREFGRGSLDGLLFVESATSAHQTGGAIPTVLFGVPGGRAWAFVMVSLLAYGIAPGPRMLEQHGDTVTMVVLSLAMGAPAVAAIAVLVTGRLARLTLLPYPAIGAIIIPVLFLVWSTSAESLAAVYVMSAAAMLGLLMKWCKWPRPPLVVGLLISPLLISATETTADPETAGMTVWPMLWPALAILSVAALAASVVFKRGRIGVAGVRPGEAEAGAGTDAGPVSTGENAPDASARPRIAMTLPNIFTMAVIGAGLWGLYASATPPSPISVSPLLASLAVVILGSVQLVFDLRQSKPGAVMDIDMRSAGLPGARRTALLMAAVVVVFMALLHVIGLRYAAILFPLGPALLFLEGRTRWIGAGGGVAFVALFKLLVLDYLLGIAQSDL